MYHGKTVRPRAKVTGTIESLSEVVYEESIDAKMNDLTVIFV